MIRFWRRKQHEDLSKKVIESLGAQAHEFDVPAIVTELNRFVHRYGIDPNTYGFWDDLFWSTAHRYDRIPENRIIEDPSFPHFPAGLRGD